MWYTIAIILILIVSLLLMLIVLIQNPKGSGFASGFTGMTQFGNVGQTNKALEKMTWTFAIIILVLSIFATVAAKPKYDKEQKSEVEEFIVNYNYQTAPINPAQINIPKQQQNQQPNK